MGPTDHGMERDSLPENSQGMERSDLSEDSSSEVTAPETDVEFWNECIGHGWKPAVLSSQRVKHINSKEIKEALAQVTGTQAADVIAGLIWSLSITRERDKYLCQQVSEIRKETAQEISAELASRIGGQDSVMIRAFRKWIWDTYVNNLAARAPMAKRPKLAIEIRITDRDGEKWEELWINGAWCVSKPRIMDGNQVAHSVALCLRDQYGIDATYELTGWKE